MANKIRGNIKKKKVMLALVVLKSFEKKLEGGRKKGVSKIDEDAGSIYKGMLYGVRLNFLFLIIRDIALKNKYFLQMIS